ncbi:MAG: tetratricopeptide repeat protein [Congregibacter sp.]
MPLLFQHALRGLLALLLLLALGTKASAAEFVGTPSCASCHSDEHALWSGSHHDLAMQKPTAETVLGDFDNALFEHFGTQTQFLRRDERFVVRTDGPDGTMTDYDVAWVFGVYPLQQYLLPLEDGRLQALSVAWDSRSNEDGGQRWYHLYPDERIAHDDPLHWTGPYQNWNTRCAECHSTDLQKNYDASTRSFSTTFFEEDVGCEACHGPGSRHVQLAKENALGLDTLQGFVTNLAAQGEWVYAEGESIAKRQQALPDRQQIDSCGRCHARRGTLGDYQHGQPLADTHRLSLLGDPLYHHDGQILDEVYVYGSFVQSKMHQAGVVCSNCHEPHSNQLRAEGNGVCAQCHKPAVYAAPAHHRHAVTSSGAQCVNCHMPTQTYMGVDARRDHSMRIPRPDLSVMVGTPNACNQCHSDKNAEWALEASRQWGVQYNDTGAHPAVAMAALQKGDLRAVPRLLSLASDTSAAPIWRASALERTANAGSREATALARSLLDSPDPLLRVSAVRALQQLPANQRYADLAPLLHDPVSGVRLEVAFGLTSTPLEQLSEKPRADLLALFSEYLSVQRQHADMPSAQMQMALFHAGRRDLPAAEAAYREALRLNPQLVAAYLNLADLMRTSGREEEARTQLSGALAIAPQSGDAMHALGLLEARTGNSSDALRWLAQAAEREEYGSRHRFVYAIAQHDFGDSAGAIKTLRRLHNSVPGDENTLLALVNYTAETDNLDSARRYAEKLLDLAPTNPAYRRLAASLVTGKGR